MNHNADTVAVPRSFAAVLGTCFAWACLTGSTLPLVALSIFMFSRWIWRARGQWTPKGNFGLANTLTAVRFALTIYVALLPAYGAVPRAGIALLAFFTLDGIDGWVARRFGTESAFGAAFDTEADALMVAVATLAAVHADLIGPWILLVGALRYVFVLVSARSNRGEEPRRRTARWAFSALMSGLIGALTTAAPFAVGILAVGAALVIVSFGRSFWWAFGPTPRR